MLSTLFMQLLIRVVFLLSIIIIRTTVLLLSFFDLFLVIVGRIAIKIETAGGIVIYLGLLFLLFFIIIAFRISNIYGVHRINLKYVLVNQQVHIIKLILGIGKIVCWINLND